MLGVGGARRGASTHALPSPRPSSPQHKLGAHRHADGRELFKAKRPEEGHK